MRTNPEIAQKPITGSPFASGQADESVLGKRVESLRLSTRTMTCLRKSRHSLNGITTIGELIGRTERELLEINGFGETCLAEIQSKLSLQGLRLKGSGANRVHESNPAVAARKQRDKLLDQIVGRIKHDPTASIEDLRELLKGPHAIITAQMTNLKTSAKPFRELRNAIQKLTIFEIYNEKLQLSEIPNVTRRQLYDYGWLTMGGELTQAAITHLESPASTIGVWMEKTGTEVKNKLGSLALFKITKVPNGPYYLIATDEETARVSLAKELAEDGYDLDPSRGCITRVAPNDLFSGRIGVLYENIEASTWIKWMLASGRAEEGMFRLYEAGDNPPRW